MGFLRKLGNWIDDNVTQPVGHWVDDNITQPILNSKWTPFVLGPMGAPVAGYQYFAKKGLWAKPDVGEIPSTDSFLDIPTIEDKAVLAARARETELMMGGARKRSFVSGPLGDQTKIPDLSKSILEA